MTTQDHNKVIGIMHLIWGGFNALILLLFVPIFLGVIPIIGADPKAPPELKMIFGFVGLLMGACAVVFGAPPIIAAYAMLKRKSWARVAAIVSSCLAALSFPFGTALCVYTLWFMFGQGERFYRGAEIQGGWRGSLGDSSALDYQKREPPDWRG